ncbi:MAG: hypothetical protein QM784_15970 [Polyangiaceae bacterium]
MLASGIGLISLLATAGNPPTVEGQRRASGRLSLAALQRAAYAPNPAPQAAGVAIAGMSEVLGNTTGLPPSALHALERIYRRRVPIDSIATPELVRNLAEASRESKRQVGALVHRSGTVDFVIVGDASGLLLPDIGRLRAAEGRFRALRLVHTHLYHEPLTRDDLTDLTRLRLDSRCRGPTLPRR